MKKIQASDREAVLKAYRSGKNIVQIASELSLNGNVVSGIVRNALNRGILVPTQAPTPEEKLKSLAKAWRESEPDSEFSVRTASGEKVYIAAYKKYGVALRIDGRKKPVLLTPDVGSHVAMKLSELSRWCIQPF